ncbi:MAG: YezD family protein [Sedimentisphaerales bacterium]|nr:YezD family protein [Sedimentisphaerales bacterium]
MSNAPKTTIDTANARIIEQLADAVKKLKFGQIIITVHNSKVVQIDKTEKIRFNEANYENGGGI